MLKAADVVFLDYGPFADEGFTSGLMIILKEMLKEYVRRGRTAQILSVRESVSAHRPPGEFDGLPLAALHEVDERAGAAVSQARIEAALRKLGARTVLLHVPSVFLSADCIAAFRAANACGAKVIAVLGDPIFPREDSDEARVYDLHAELAKLEVVGVGDDTRRIFTEVTGVATRRLVNPFSVEAIRLPTDRPPGRRIGMVNIHPLKGRQVFDEVARRMPEHDFLIVKNWPDAPPYTPGPNVELAAFYDDPRDLYGQLSVLLVPSLWGEGPARVVTEALCNGIPVVAHAIGSLGEFAEYSVDFVTPPRIDRYEMVGTVLCPVMDEAEIARAADDFVLRLRAILGDAATYQARSDQARAQGERYLVNSARAFAAHFDRWAAADTEAA